MIREELSTISTDYLPRQRAELLELNGCLVTIGAMGCQAEIAQGILSREADTCWRLGRVCQGV